MTHSTACYVRTRYVTGNGMLKREMLLYKEGKIYLWVAGRDFSLWARYRALITNAGLRT